MGTYLLKFGGNAIRGRDDLSRLAGEVAELVAGGHRIVLVHGGGPEISEEMERRGMTPRKVAGVRVTDEASLEVAEVVLRRINGDVVASLTDKGVPAVGMPAYMCTVCRRKPPVQVDGETVDLGLVGEVEATDPSSIDDLLDSGVVPVIYPIGRDAEGGMLNVNADTMAAGIAAGVGCDEMITITDVPGILLDVNDPSSKLDRVTLAEVDELIASGVISGGMIPKVEACRRALEAGAGAVRMVNGKDPRNIVSDIVRGVPHGTLITRRFRMDFEEIKSKSQRYLFQNYGRIDLSFVRGEGCYLYDTEGRRYLDLVAGIAVNALGYAHPDWVAAVTDQAGKLAHVSNLYHVEQQAELAERIAAIAPGDIDRSLFVNSGTEANEAALKMAVKYTGRSKVLSARNGFHGRTAASLGATAQEVFHRGFEPLIPDAFGYFDYGDAESLKAAMSKDTAAVIVEPIQGESGVLTAPGEFFRAVRDLCTDCGALMIVDEVQTGIGRTGEWYGIQNFGVEPDAVTMAKGLGGGVPIGALASTEEFASTLTPGSHGTTFGGSPLVCRAGCATLDIIKRDGLVPRAKELGARWMADLRAIDSPRIREVRGYGLMIGVELDSPETAREVQVRCRERGILVNVAHGANIRLVPPLIVTYEQTREFTDALADILG